MEIMDTKCAAELAELVDWVGNEDSGGLHQERTLHDVEDWFSRKKS